MPFYEVQHIVPLSVAQQDELADALTTIHSTHFSTPRMFVNVGFTDVTDRVMYIGGRRRNENIIAATVRTGPARTQQHWQELCEAVIAAWDRIVPMPTVKRGAPAQDFRLRACVVLGSLTAGWEAGFMVPPAGGDVDWLKEHWAEFTRRAEEGDEELAEMVKEVQGRGLLEGTNGHAAA